MKKLLFIFFLLTIPHIKPSKNFIKKVKGAYIGANIKSAILDPIAPEKLPTIAPNIVEIVKIKLSPKFIYPLFVGNGIVIIKVVIHIKAANILGNTIF